MRNNGLDRSIRCPLPATSVLNEFKCQLGRNSDADGIFDSEDLAQTCSKWPKTAYFQGSGETIRGATAAGLRPRAKFQVSVPV